MTIYYRNKESGKIEGKFVGCATQSVRFCDTSKYERFVSDSDLPLEVISKTTQPEIPKILKLESSDGSVWNLTIDNSGKVKASKIREN